jgi:hypothetical protein
LKFSFAVPGACAIIESIFYHKFSVDLKNNNFLDETIKAVIITNILKPFCAITSIYRLQTITNYSKKYVHL